MDADPRYVHELMMPDLLLELFGVLIFVQQLHLEKGEWIAF